MACHSLLILIYSFILQALKPLLRLLARFSPKLAAQLAGRELTPTSIIKIARQRAAARHAVVYFCSSAGEFEQAKPIIDRFAQDGDIYQHVIFFSQSGSSYATARGDTLPYSLSPIDSCFAWGSLLSALRPEIVVVVRHELWPAFLHTARQFAQVVLIDAVVKPEEQGWSRLRRWLRRQLYLLFNRIFVVTNSDQDGLASVYKLPPKSVQVAGDTKYDRVVERVRHYHQVTSSQLHPALTRNERYTGRLVIGSAHRPDVDIVLRARSLLPASIRSKWQLIIAPHDISHEMISWIINSCQAEGLRVWRYSQLNDEQLAPGDVLIVDVMGRLAEIYGTAEAAFVGGAMHHQVHNVLEPAAHGLALAFGPHHRNSKEAIHLVTSGLATVCLTPEAVSTWWQELAASDPKTTQRAMLAAVNGLTGAADLIHQELKQVLTPPSQAAPTS